MLGSNGTRFAHVSYIQTMSTPTKSQEVDSFLNLVTENDNFLVEELTPANRSQVSQFLSNRAMENAGEYQRTFLVQIKSPKAKKLPSEFTPASRLYLLKSADLLLTEGDFVLARNIYAYLLKINIRDVEALKGLGICLLKISDPAAAKKCFMAARELGGGDEMRLWISQCCSAQGEHQRALDELKLVTVPSSLTPVFRFEYFKELGNGETRLGQYDLAIKNYKSALLLSEESDVLWVNLGTAELHKKDLTSAGLSFSKALTLNPKNARARCGLGLIALEKGDQKTAEKEFHDSLGNDPLNSVALYQLIAASFRTEQYDGALFRIEIYLSKNPKDPEIRYAKAAIHFRKREWKVSEVELDKILALNANHSRARILREQLSSQKIRGDI